MDETLLNLLRQVDTPTVCNAIEVVEGRRGFDRFTRGTLIAANPTAGAIVGRARTARISAAKPPSSPPEAVRAIRMDYYRQLAEASGPTVAVVEDVDEEPVGAYWGEVNTEIHKGFGVAGALTNGVMRDLGDHAPGFQVLAGSIGPSHAFVHVLEVAVPVRVFGLEVAPDDWIHADRHGAVVIPEAMLPDLEAAIHKMRTTEAIVLEAARAPGFDFAAFEEAWARFEAART